MAENHFIRLAPAQDDPTLRLSRDEALAEANVAFQRARKAQGRLVSHLELTERLTDPGTVSYPKLRGMLREAEEQRDRAQAVVVALMESMDALERYRNRPSTPPDSTGSEFSIPPASTTVVAQCGACGGLIPPLPVACPADPRSYCAAESVSACTYYAGCSSPAKSCGYCTDHCLCDVGVRSSPASSSPEEGA